MSVIFAVPRFHYASYADYYRLIELSGFDQCFIDEIDQSSNNTYIITIYNGEFGDYSGSRARIVLTDIEYHIGENALPPLPNVEVFACDAWYAKQIGAKYWAMGSHAGLRLTNTPINPAYDVAYIGFITGLHRREVIRQQLIERGVAVSPIVAWGEQRDVILNASRAYLHVHQHAHIPTIAPLRMVVAAAYSLPVISEFIEDAGVLKPYVLQTSYQNLPDSVANSRGTSLPQFLSGDPLHWFLTEKLTFRKSVEAAL